MLDPNRKYVFEYQDLPNGVRIVSLDCRIKDLHPQPRMVNGEIKLMVPAVTTKDCRSIDGCIYYHLGRCQEIYMNEDSMDMLFGWYDTFELIDTIFSFFIHLINAL